MKKKKINPNYRLGVHLIRNMEYYGMKFFIVYWSSYLNLIQFHTILCFFVFLIHFLRYHVLERAKETTNSILGCLLVDDIMGKFIKVN